MVGARAIALVVVVLTSAFQDPGASYSQVPEREVRVYQSGNIVSDTFEIRHVLRGEQLTIALHTDLPDYTHLMVSVDRTYQQQGSSDRYVVSYFAEGSTVGEWRSAKTISLDNKRWKQELEKSRRILATAGEPFTVSTISSQITIGFTVPINQPPPFEMGNANLVGSVVKESIFGRIIEQEILVDYPIDESGVGNVEWGDPFALEQGRRYQVSRRTPIMPDVSPADPVRALADVRYLPSGASFTVRGVRSVSGSPWYRVTGRVGGKDVQGWINSTALIGQVLRVVRR